MNQTITFAALLWAVISTSVASPFEIHAASESSTTTATRMPIKNHKPPRAVYVEPPVLVDHTAIESAKFQRGNSDDSVILVFFLTADGAKRYATVTADLLKKQMAIVSGGELLWAGIVHGASTGNGLQLKVHVTAEEAARIIDSINTSLRKPK